MVGSEVQLWEEASSQMKPVSVRGDDLGRLLNGGCR